MDSKIFGFPLILLILVVLTAIVVDVPMILLNHTTDTRLTRLESNTENAQLGVEKLLLISVTPSATPSAVPTPTVTFKSVQPTVKSQVK